MTLSELFERVKDLPPETPVCVAEEDEAAGMNVAGVEVVREAETTERRDGRSGGGRDRAGEDTVVVIRW